MAMEILAKMKRNKTYEYTFSDKDLSLLNDVYKELSIQDCTNKYEQFAIKLYEFVRAHLCELVEPLLMMKFIAEHIGDRRDEIGDKEKIHSEKGHIEIKKSSPNTTVDLYMNPELAKRTAEICPEAIQVSQSKIMEYYKKNPSDELRDIARDIQFLKDNGFTRDTSKEGVSILDVVTSYRQLQAIIAKTEEWEALLRGA